MNKNLARIAELLAEAQQLFPNLTEDSQRQIAATAFIEENNDRRHQERSGGYSKPFVTAASKPSATAQYHAAAQNTPPIPGLDNVSKDLKGQLEIQKETSQGSLVCKIGETEFLIFSSSPVLMTNAKFWKGGHVRARVQERTRQKDNKKYWMCIGLDLNPDDNIP